MIVYGAVSGFLPGLKCDFMYDYAPTPRGIHAAVEDALRGQKELVRPGEKELLQVQERGRLPEDERQLHALLMTEGDLTGFSAHPSSAPCRSCSGKPC